MTGGSSDRETPDPGDGSTATHRPAVYRSREGGNLFKCGSPTRALVANRARAGFTDYDINPENEYDYPSVDSPCGGPFTVARAVFFDLDETLIEHTLDGPALIARIHAMFPVAFGDVDARQFGVVLREKGQALWGTMFEPTEPGDQALVSMFRDTLEALGRDPVHARALRDAFIDTVLNGTKLYPGATAVLDRLRAAGMTTGIITNGYSYLQDAKIERHGLRPLVDFVVVSEAAGAHKPDERIFHLALNRAETAPEDAWHVGDHLVNDIAGAEDAGLTGVLFDPRGDRLPATEAGLPEGGRMPTHTVSDLNEVARLAQEARTRA